MQGIDSEILGRELGFSHFRPVSSKDIGVPDVKERCRSSKCRGVSGHQGQYLATSFPNVGSEVYISRLSDIASCSRLSYYSCRLHPSAAADSHGPLFGDKVPFLVPYLVVRPVTDGATDGNDRLARQGPPRRNIRGQRQYIRVYMMQENGSRIRATRCISEWEEAVRFTITTG
jgi:hypothetical protein